MTRPIKFRAEWKGKVYPVIEISWDTSRVVLHAPSGNDLCMHMDQVNLIQFTGLLDKNGKEMWEGDIIYSPAFDAMRWEVIYTMGGFWASDNKGTSWPLSTYHDISEIIGNIYEHKELLK